MCDELGRVDRCVGFLRQMSWPAAGVAADILQRMKTEWVPDAAHLTDADNILAIANIKSQLSNLSGTASIEALKDPESDLAILLRSIGWQPPTEGAPLLVNNVTPTSASGPSATDPRTCVQLQGQQADGGPVVPDPTAQPFWGFDMSMEDYVSSDLSGFASFFGDYGSPFTQA